MSKSQARCGSAKVFHHRIVDHEEWAQRAALMSLLPICIRLACWQGGRQQGSRRCIARAARTI